MLFLPPWGVALHRWFTPPRGQELGCGQFCVTHKALQARSAGIYWRRTMYKTQGLRAGTCTLPGLLSQTPDLSSQHLHHISVWMASGWLHLSRSQSELLKSPHPAPLLQPSHRRQGHVRFPTPLLRPKTLGLSLISLSVSLSPLPPSIHQQILVAQLSKYISCLSPSLYTHCQFQPTLRTFFRLPKRESLQEWAPCHHWGSTTSACGGGEVKVRGA